MASIFDAFSAPNTAGPQITGLTNAFNYAAPQIQQGSADLTNYYTSALLPFMQNYGTATQGTTALGNALGLNGPAGNAAATQAFWNNPAIQSQLDVGSQNVLRNQAAAGQLNSGATDTALQNFGQQTAAQGWQNYVNSLQPFLGASNQAAGGIANVNTGLGSALNANQGNLAQLGWATNTGVGNALANQNIENTQAAAAPWNLLLGLGGMKTNNNGTVGGNLLTSGFSSLGSGLSCLGSGLNNLLFSDERLKENIKPVGELYDGTNIYSYRYKDDPTPRIGVLAQEIEGKFPDAVVDVGGWKAVDYGRATELASALSRFTDSESNLSRFRRRARPIIRMRLSVFLRPPDDAVVPNMDRAHGADQFAASRPTALMG